MTETMQGTSEAADDPAAQAAGSSDRSPVVSPSRSCVLEIPLRGVARGVVRPAALTHRLAGVGHSLLRQHFLVHGAPVPDTVIVEIVDDVLIRRTTRPAPTSTQSGADD